MPYILDAPGQFDEYMKNEGYREKSYMSKYY